MEREVGSYDGCAAAFFFFLPAHLVEENSLDLNVSYSN